MRTPIPSRRTLRAGASLLVALTLAAGLVACGEEDDPSDTTAAPSTTAAPTTSSTEAPDPEPGEDAELLAVYFARGEDVAAASAAAEGSEPARAALEALLTGPDEAAAAAGMSTAIPAGTELLDLALADGRATVDLSGEFVSGGGSLSMQLRAAQVVFTLTQFDTIDTVSFRIDGLDVAGLGGEGVPAADVDRSEFTDVTPLVLVTSPLPGEAVTSPVTVEGISNTFEATVLYELLGPDDEVLAEGFTTATAGSGTWGEFSVEIEWDAAATGQGTLVLFQENMESGGRQDVYEVPVDLAG